MTTSYFRVGYGVGGDEEEAEVAIGIEVAEPEVGVVVGTANETPGTRLGPMERGGELEVHPEERCMDHTAGEGSRAEGVATDRTVQWADEGHRSAGRRQQRGEQSTPAGTAAVIAAEAAIRRDVRSGGGERSGTNPETVLPRAWITEVPPLASLATPSHPIPPQPNLTQPNPTQPNPYHAMPCQR